MLVVVVVGDGDGEGGRAQRLADEREREAAAERGHEDDLLLGRRLHGRDDGAPRPPLAVPTLGGSGPSYLFTEILGAPVVTLPIANYDNNQHAANENLRLQNLWDGIEMYAGLLTRLGRVWDARVVP